METIRDLISRILWDRTFARGDFEIAYLDHDTDELVRVPFNELVFDSDTHFFVHVYDQDGNESSIPLHRIKSVYKDGVLVWHREH